jgi:hypothetical protein
VIIRLDSVSTTLADAFRKASPEQRRQAASAACELAVSSVGLVGQEIDAALITIRRGATAENSLRQQLEGLASQCDDEYLRLEEEGGESKKSESLRSFSKARALSALAFALIDDPKPLHEAIYEAIAATDDPSGVVRAAERALQQPDPVKPVS